MTIFKNEFIGFFRSYKLDDLLGLYKHINDFSSNRRSKKFDSFIASGFSYIYNRKSLTSQELKNNKSYIKSVLVSDFIDYMHKKLNLSY